MATSVFKTLTLDPPKDPKVPEELDRVLNEFVVRLYGLPGDDVDAARLDGFYYQGRQFSNLPPGSDALGQHLLRAIYQGGHVWGQCLTRNPEYPDAASWGWTKESGCWKPVWILSPIISAKLPQLVSCKCKKECRARCSCKRKCTPLCACRGNCCKEQ